MFKSPYSQLDPELTTRISAQVSNADYHQIRAIRPGAGTIQNTIGLLWSKLCGRLSELEIIDFNQINEYESFVTNCVILSKSEHDQLLHDQRQLTRRRLFDSPIGGTESEGFPRNDGAGTTGAGDGDSTTPSESSNLQSGSGRSGETKDQQKSIKSKKTKSSGIGLGGGDV